MHPSQLRVRETFPWSSRKMTTRMLTVAMAIIACLFPIPFRGCGGDSISSSQRL